MSGKIDLNNLYSSMQEEMLGRLNVGRVAFLHPGTKGDDTELNWIEWFRTYLPKRYDVSGGIIIDSNGNQSDQIDIIIYDTQYSYLVFNHNDKKLIPAESVYAVFEIKPNLNKEHIEYACQKVFSVRKLYRTSAPIKHAGGEYPPKSLHEIIGGLLTTDTDWTKPTIGNVSKYINGACKDERLDIVSTANDSTYIVDNNTFIDDYDEKRFVKINFCDDNNSLVFLLLNVLKKLQDIGTVPAIDFLKYENCIHSKFYKET